MKVCKVCGKKITLGVNGCTMMDDCFDCHGGYPKYAKPTTENLHNIENACLCISEWASNQEHDNVAIANWGDVGSTAKVYEDLKEIGVFLDITIKEV